MKKMIGLTLRLSTIKRVREECLKEDRNISNMINWILDEYFKEKDKEK